MAKREMDTEMTMNMATRRPQLLVTAFEQRVKCFMTGLWDSGILSSSRWGSFTFDHMYATQTNGM